VSWLEPPSDAVEEMLREALDQARARTGDEIARRRVWTRIGAPDQPSRVRPWMARLALAGTLAGGAAGAVLVWPRSTGHELATLPAASTTRTSTRTEARDLPPRREVFDGPAVVRTTSRQRAKIRLFGGTDVDLEPNSVVSVDRQRRPSIERGRVSLAVPRQPPGKHFSIGAGPYSISVLGTKFQVRVAGESVGVDVEEGVVEVWKDGQAVRVEPGEAWTSPTPERAASRHSSRRHRLAMRSPIQQVTAATPKVMLRPTPPPVMPSSGPFREAQTAIAEGHLQRAVEILETASRGTGPEAENAAYEVGWLLRDQLMRPRQALSAWNRYRSRFSNGLLRAETDLSILETLLMVGDTSAALNEAQGFLDRHPRSERRAEIAEVVRRLRGQTEPAPSAPDGPSTASR
jgi:ferric-dicitrate binding protein FerR (iron transport regulator)